MKSLYWKLTAPFVVVTLCVYISLTALGLYLFNAGLNEQFDLQLDALLAEEAQRVEFDGMNVHLVPLSGKVRSLPYRPLASFELFDNSGKLVDGSGNHRCSVLFTDMREIHGLPTLRSKSAPVMFEGRQVGWLQAQLPTTQRNEALWRFGIVMSIVTLLLFILLLYAGYVFSKQVSYPLLQSYEMLRQFSNDIAHELNTPISTLRATAENMSEELSEPDSLKARLEVMNRAIDRMGLIVKDLMLLTRLGIESAERSKQPEDVALADLVENVAKEFADRFKQKKIELSTNINAHPVIKGFPDPLHRMLANLLENAFRYTDSGGKVQISLASEHSHPIITVSDTGIGIPQESLPKIFDRFYRVDKARSREQGGTGLGLSIVKAIVAMHKATVRVESEVGKGTSFVITLPAPRVRLKESIEFTPPQVVKDQS